MKVTAFAVDHGDLVKPAFGYRIDFGGRSAVVSGDTRFNENLIHHATGTDILIHQVAAVRPELLAVPVFQALLAHHTKPEQAGTVFARTKPGLAVFYHFSLLGTPQVPPMTEQEVVELARKNYSGPLLVGEDLMVFRILCLPRGAHQLQGTGSVPSPRWDSMATNASAPQPKGWIAVETNAGDRRCLATQTPHLPSMAK